VNLNGCISDLKVVMN